MASQRERLSGLNGLRLLWSKVYSIPASCYPPVCLDEPLGRPFIPTPSASNAPSPRPLGHKTRRIGLSTPKKARIMLGQGPQEAAKNLRIMSGLERAYGSEKAKSVLDQAISIFHVANPHAENSPEPYELFENGQIDQALEMFGASPWVIGRVKP